MNSNGSFFAGDKPDGKFMALFQDGSGGVVFMTIDGHDGQDMYMHGEMGDEVDYDWFLDAGYSIWVKIPDEHILWVERRK